MNKESVNRDFLTQALTGAGLGASGLFGLYALQDAMSSLYNKIDPSVKIPRNIEVDIEPYKKKNKEKKADYMSHLLDTGEGQKKEADWFGIEEGIERMGETLKGNLGYMTGFVPGVYFAAKAYNALDKRKKDLEYAKKIKEFEDTMERAFNSRKKTASYYTEGFRRGIEEVVGEKALEKKAQENGGLEKKAFDPWHLYTGLLAGLIPTGFLAGYHTGKYYMPVPGSDDMSFEAPKVRFVDKKQDQKLQKAAGELQKSAEQTDAGYMQKYFYPLAVAGALYGAYRLAQSTERGPYGFLPFFSESDKKKKQKSNKEHLNAS